MARVVQALVLEARGEIRRLFAPELGVFAHQPVVDAFGFEAGNLDVQVAEEDERGRAEQREKQRREAEARRAVEFS